MQKKQDRLNKKITLFLLSVSVRCA